MGKNKSSKSTAESKPERADKLVKVTSNTRSVLKIGAARRNQSIGELIATLAKGVDK